MNKSSTGFTLVELMIGLIIVSILAVIAIPNFSKAVEKTKVKDAQTTLAAIYSSEKIYRLDQNSYGNLGTLGSGKPDDLIRNNYISDPDANNSNTTWDFSATIGGVGGSTFIATATRTGGSYDNTTVTVTDTFSGTSYGGTHPLRDQ